MNHFLRNKGFSLIELFFSLMIISIVIIFSIMGLQEYQKKREIKLYAKALYHDLKWARIEAVLLNQPVKIMPNNNQWCDGWLLFLDSKNKSENKNANYNFSENILKQQAGLSHCKIKFSSFPARQYFRFLPEGISDYQNGSYYFYSNTNASASTGINSGAELLSKVIVSQMGRVRFE